MSKYKNKMIRNTMVSFIDKIFSFALPFVLFPFIVKHLGVESSGIWFFCSAAVGYCGILDQGPGPAIAKFVAENYSKKNVLEINKYLSSGFLIFLCFGVIAMLVMFLFAHFGQLLFKIEASLIALYKQVFYLMGITLLISFPLKVFNSVLRGLQEYKVIAVTNVGAMIVRAVLTVVLLLKGAGVIALISINFLWLLLCYGAQFLVIRIKYPEIRIQKSLLSRVHLRAILNFGGIMFVISLCAVFIFQTDRIILGAFLSIASVTYYTACKRIYDLCRWVPVLILQAIMPMASELRSLDQDETNKKILMLGTKYSYAMFIPLGIFIICMASDILRVWVGQEYMQYGICLQILTFHLFFSFLHQAGSQVLIGINKIRFILPYYILALIGNIGLSLLLIKKYQMAGVAMGTTIPFVLLEWLYVKKMLRILEVRVVDFLREVLLRNGANFIVAVIMTLMVKYFFVIENVGSLFLATTFIFGVSIGAFVVTGMGKRERVTIIKAIGFS